MKPILINNLEFAQKNLEISGDLSPLDCLRLGEMLSSNDKNQASIHYTLKGFAKGMHLPSMHLQVESILPVLCQRCLEAMQIELNLNFDYLICENSPDEADENDEIDWLEPSQHMNLNEMIEDELLIAMPIAPVHAADCTKANMQSGERPNPFAVLKGKF
ncbi:MAG: YceD family protein [Methylophilaceae bacterium]